MKLSRRTLMRVVASILALICAPLAVSARILPAPERARIEVAFVLDTTGSMGGLLEGAKVKIWSIANQMVSARPTPELRIALVAYRDRGDDYVTRVFDLDDDIDAVYARLQGLSAAGGGDSPESVNQALHEAVTGLDWSPQGRVLKIVFLVGDCPPHVDYVGDVPYAESCQRAVLQGLIINTVQCGDNSDTTPIWQEIARRAEGRYVAIGQGGDMQVIETPVDKELARLNQRLGQTLIAFGSAHKRRAVMAKQRAAEAAPMATSADRLAFNAATGKTVQGGGDLIDEIDAGRIRLEEVAEEQLPAELRGLSSAQRKDYLVAVRRERVKIQTRIDELLTERRDDLAREMRRLAADGRGHPFDLRILEILREQGRAKGLRF